MLTCYMYENTVWYMLYFGESNKKQMLVKKKTVNKNTLSYMQDSVNLSDNLWCAPGTTSNGSLKCLFQQHL